MRGGSGTKSKEFLYDPENGPIVYVEVSYPSSAAPLHTGPIVPMKVKMLIDTGAQGTHVSTEIGHGLLVSDPGTESRLDGKVNAILGYIGDLHFPDFDITKPGWRLLEYRNKHGHYDGVIGRDILNQGRFCLEPRKLTFTLSLPCQESADFEPGNIDELVPLPYSADDMKAGLDCYDPEGRVFPDFCEAKHGRKLSKRDVLLILKWKLGRIKDSNSITVNDENMDKINQAIEDARKPNGEIAALTALERVPGVGLATATAIMTVCYPNDFTIIDQRVLGELDIFPSRLAERRPKKHNTDHWTAADYVREYLPKVKEFRKHWECTLRDTDRALWGLSVSKQVDKFIAESEKV